MKLYFIHLVLFFDYQSFYIYYSFLLLQFRSKIEFGRMKLTSLMVEFYN